MNRLVLALAATIASFASPALATPRSEVLALVVTNNHSSESGRPELHYADDDGAKYYDLFRMLAADDDVELLTEFDRDSAQLFPDARAKAHVPTRAEVDAAVARLARRARAARDQGRATELYFVFAGHGDVDHGRGFLELRDSRLMSDDLEKILREVGATRAHVILDSCNSFFVMSPRKPGGRQIAVTEQAAQSLAERLPDVGVFLSTSAEAEVFEWSELQSGIFSHAVRSGLAGAADANHDGEISYDELHAFVEIATAQVKNPLYRPKVFARAPGGNGSTPIFDLAGARARRIELAAGPARLTVRDPDELPWIDVHQEANAAMTLYLPERWAAQASVDVHAADGTITRHAMVAGDAPVRLAELASTTVPGTPRGPNELLATLFAAPFGPVAFAAWRDDISHAPGQVYGVSNEDAERMRMLLAQVADVERGGRHVAGMGMFAMAGLFAAADYAAAPTPSSRDEILAFDLGLFGTAGTITLFKRSEGEKLYDDYMARMADPNSDKARLVADTERRLNKLADQYHFVRELEGTAGALLVGTSGFLLFTNEHAIQTSQDRATGRLVFGSAGVIGLTVIGLALQKTPIERMRELWTHDPGITSLPRVGVSFAPTRGGAYFGLGGSF